MSSKPGSEYAQMETPADPGYVAILRLAAAGIAARAGLTIDDVEDVRLAVDEACALLLPHAAPDSRLGARFELEEGCVSVELSVRREGPGPLDQNGYGWFLLKVLATTVEVRDDVQLTITLTREAAVDPK